VEFRIVGPIQVPIPEAITHNPKVRFTGTVTRSEVVEHYQWADLFLFPTFSDGFGLTQLEAQAWKIPILASRFCGDVVENGRNGLLLDELSGEAIARSIRSVLSAPAELDRMSAASGIEKQFTISCLSNRLTSLIDRSGAERHA
jgi:glycosyltransferase involved in cell wall biosynthesis